MEWEPMWWNNRELQWGKGSTTSCMTGLPSYLYRKESKEKDWRQGAHLPLRKYSHFPQLTSAEWCTWDSVECISLFFFFSRGDCVSKEINQGNSCLHIKGICFHLVQKNFILTTFTLFFHSSDLLDKFTASMFIESLLLCKINCH